MSKPDHAQVLMPPPLLYLITLALAMALDYLYALPYLLPAPVRIGAGLTLLVTGLMICLWGITALRRAGTEVLPQRGTSMIVAQGPYRFSRNPLYMGMNLMYLGLILASSLNWGWVLFVPLFATVHFGVILREERYLAEKFGDSYLTYQKRVRRYL